MEDRDVSETSERRFEIRLRDGVENDILED
jgi:hypothetical protein